MHACDIPHSGVPIFSEFLMILHHQISKRVRRALPCNLLVQTLPVLCAVFAAFGEDLDALRVFAQINVDLAILTVDLVLHTHQTTPET